MMKLIVYQSLLSYIIVTTHGFGFLSFHYESFLENSINNAPRDDIPEKWISQPLNHFDVRDDRSWLMRYYENEEFYNGTGPIFIFLGGEWTIVPSFLRFGLMYDLASTHGAMMYYTEHRYYGDSRPVGNTDPENIVFLNIDQALADIAYFIETKKNVLGSSNRSVFVFGGSYSGNLAAWARLKYPHLIQGALASSAPVHAKADFTDYYRVVTDALEKYDEQCVDDVKSAIDTVELLLSEENGAQLLQSSFSLCHIPNVTSITDVGLVMNNIAEIFAGAVQYNTVGLDEKSTIGNLCDKMMNSSIKSPFQRLADIIKKSKCIDWSYDSFVKRLTNTSWDAKQNMRLWIYQSCTEYGYFQTSSGINSTFGTLFPSQFFIQMCSDLFGNYYDADLVDSRVRRTNIMYGGPLPDLTHVIFTNGNIDPWHPLSILKDINEQTIAILMDGASHAVDLQPDHPADIEEVTKARQKIRLIINEWIAMGKKIQ